MFPICRIYAAINRLRQHVQTTMKLIYGCPERIIRIFNDSALNVVTSRLAEVAARLLQTQSIHLDVIWIQIPWFDPVRPSVSKFHVNFYFGNCFIKLPSLYKYIHVCKSMPDASVLYHLSNSRISFFRIKTDECYMHLLRHWYNNYVFLIFSMDI